MDDLNKMKSTVFANGQAIASNITSMLDNLEKQRVAVEAAGKTEEAARLEKKITILDSYKTIAETNLAKITGKQETAAADIVT